MQDTTCDKPIAVIDFANNRIRIRKKTILSLGSPESILLLINPEKLTLGIMGCANDMQGSHRIRLHPKHCYELYSKSLVMAMKKAFSYWDGEKSYRLTGDYINTEGIACFNLSESVPIKPDEVEL